MVSVWKEFDMNSAKFLIKVHETCERVFATDTMQALYKRLLKEVEERQRYGPTLLNSLQLYLLWKETKKVQIILTSTLTPVDGEEEVEDEDREFIRLAKVTGAILVTYDKKLLKLASILGYQAAKPSDLLQKP